MASATTKDKMEFAYLMAKHSTASLHDLQRLMRYGSTYHAIQVAWCNDVMPEDVAKRVEIKMEKIEATVRKICRTFDAKAKFGGDPRGCTVKIQVSDGYTNDWGREGICVPTS